MSLLKKLIALALVSIISVTAFSISAFADPFDDAIAIDSGDEVKATITDSAGSVTYEVNSKGAGELVVNWSIASSRTYIYVYDEDGAYLNTESLTIKGGELLYCKVGSDYVRGNWNNASERFSGTSTYKVNKGNYYITIKRDYSSGSGAVKVTADFPTKTEKDLTYLGITMKKGETMQLEPVGLSSGSVKWTSSKKAVASVTTKGNITAKKKGTTVISCTYNGKTVKLKVTVK